MTKKQQTLKLAPELVDKLKEQAERDNVPFNKLCEDTLAERVEGGSVHSKLDRILKELKKLSSSS